ncbi:MAG TPA: DegT/DnrJ/EryC1/StrS aminotransferase family protein [Bryobacteraceae bacterium]|jgi:dTDP-4-amino-4,6-dideoxygalactose transaminase|nr:DegT/DnrJ/EryC1/StrS aminotransferase family protein [Bryobacteraceae bacterium]
MEEVIVDPLSEPVSARVRSRPWPAWPHFEAEDIAAVADVLASGRVNYWTGEQGRAFEQEFAAYTHTRYGVAVANGTLALELALRALGIGTGDEVIVPARTFFGCVTSVVACGARPVFADVDRDSQNLTAATIEAVLTQSTRAILVVHLQGWPCEMDEILALARARKLAVLEDCAHAHGAAYRGRTVGSLGDIGAFSFCQDKIMTTGGEGGMLVTNDPELWRRLWSYKDHGKSHELAHAGESNGAFRWVHESFGTNARLTEIQSALGRRLLMRLPANVQKRRDNAACLREALANITALRIPEPPAHVDHAYYKQYAFLKPRGLAQNWTRDDIVNAIRAEGIPCSSGICSEVYREQAIPAEWRPPQRLPAAAELGETSLMFQVHPTLDRSDMLDTAAAVRKVLARACRS